MFGMFTTVEEVVQESGKVIVVNANSLYLASSLVNDRLITVRHEARCEDVARQRELPAITYTVEELAYINRP